MQHFLCILYIFIGKSCFCQVRIILGGGRQLCNINKLTSERTQGKKGSVLRKVLDPSLLPFVLNGGHNSYKGNILESTVPTRLQVIGYPCQTNIEQINLS